MDEGLRKAVKKQHSYRLPSNFSYKLMERIRLEEAERERKRERRLYIFMLATTVLMFSSYLGFMLWLFPNSINNMMSYIGSFVDDISIPWMLMSILITLPFLFVFNVFLKWKFGKHNVD